jgi:hypothetical protein
MRADGVDTAALRGMLYALAAATRLGRPIDDRISSAGTELFPPPRQPDHATFNLHQVNLHQVNPHQG